MSLLNIFENPEKKQNKDYFAHLVNIALADSVITPEERKLLDRIGNKLGFSDQEIDHIIEKEIKSDYIPPYELSKRFEQVYDIVKMILADDEVTETEMHLAKRFALKSDFQESDISSLLNLLIEGIKEGKDEEDLLKEYLKNWKARNRN